ncbi:JAB domain-containing protein [[Bacillus] enclensis]|uniref:JAB domain-containing protein n=1 Tax=[Bacillus] enclensis TaxID=1402860 RepID=A0A1C3YSY0_9BACI|nr:JAB domain-containing protein [[Bacillus] enclensis]
MATEICRMRNVDRSPVSFSMSENEISRAFKGFKNRDEEWMAIYHSHPTDRAYPSQEDILFHNYPEIPYIIVSLVQNKPAVRCFLIENSLVTELKIELV